MSRFSVFSYRSLALSALAVAGLLAFSQAAIAETISIDVPNFSFELPVLPGTQTFDPHAPNNWLVTIGWAGYSNSGNSKVTGITGTQTAYANAVSYSHTSSLWSATGLTTLAPDTTYELSVDVAARPDWAADGFSLSLCNGNAMNNGLGTTVFATTGNLVPVSAVLTTTTLSFTTGSSVDTTEDLYICLSALYSGHDGQIAFDNVRLTATTAPVPEPSTLALLAGGLFGLIAYAWRKRK
jgi:hypothetical protein